MPDIHLKVVFLRYSLVLVSITGPNLELRRLVFECSPYPPPSLADPPILESFANSRLSYNKLDHQQLCLIIRNNMSKHQILLIFPWLNRRVQALPGTVV